MYTPPAFRWDDHTAALAFVREWNFGALVTIVDGAPLVSHLPFLVDESRNVLRAHLARANPQAAHIQGREHLAVFLGPHGYISPEWYGAGSPDVPTWNYVAVHVAGEGRVIDAEQAVDDFLATLSEQEEKRRHDLEQGGKIWTLDKVPAAKHALMRGAIVVFEIEIARIEAKAKLSQNKPTEIAERVVSALQTGDETQRTLAKSMQEARRRGKS